MSANANDCWWMGTLSTGGLHMSNTEPLAEAKKQQNKKQITCGYGMQCPDYQEVAWTHATLACLVITCEVNFHRTAALLQVHY